LTIKNETRANLLHDEIFLNIWTEFFAEVPPVDAPLLTTGLNSAQLPMLASRLGQTFSVNVSSMFLLEHPTIRQIATALEDLLSDSPQTYDAPPASVKTRTESLKNVSLGNVVFHAPGSLRTASSFRFSVERGLNFGSRVPMSRWDVSNATRASATYGNFAEDILTLPHGDWKMSKSELRNVNPVQLLLLEASHSMFDGRHKADKNVGIFVGLFSSLLTPGSSTAAPSREPLGIYEGTANSTSIASGRISYVLGFTGPCLPVDTACSASLVATHLAATSLRQNECSSAGVVAGGILETGLHAAFSTAGMLSETGRCHSFDGRADGYSRGEGCVGFVCDTSEDGPSLRGSAVKQDGPSASLTAPNGASQRMLLQRVSERAGSAHDVVALEAHGTGTTLGDPVEIGAASTALRDSTVACTSVKGNIGHLEAAAAVIGLNSLLLFPLSSTLNAPLCTLRSINSHLKSLNLNAFYFLTGLANL
jgi:3-oxoacyl-(acyl-carrier-protein) synthase